MPSRITRGTAKQKGPLPAGKRTFSEAKPPLKNKGEMPSLVQSA